MREKPISGEKKQWDELPTVARLLMRHYFPNRAPKAGLEDDMSMALDDKRIRRIAEVGVEQLFYEEPAMIQRAAFELAAVSSKSDEDEADAKQIKEHVDKGVLTAAEKHLSYLAMLISTEIEFPQKTEEGFLKSTPVLI